MAGGIEQERIHYSKRNGAEGRPISPQTREEIFRHGKVALGAEQSICIMGHGTSL